jgi:nickel superoxide dismutase
MKNIKYFGIAALFMIFLANKTFAHCEVPCGIFNDELRIALLYEHFTTIEKAMKQIEELSNAEEEDYMTITRWTITKEDHANKIQHEVTQYFITQRIKLPDTNEGPVYEKYVKELALLHQLIVYAMKAKQTTDQQYVEKLRTSLAAFEESYFEGQHRHKIKQDDH